MDRPRPLTNHHLTNRHLTNHWAATPKDLGLPLGFPQGHHCYSKACGGLLPFSVATPVQGGGWRAATDAPYRGAPQNDYL